MLPLRASLYNVVLWLAAVSASANNCHIEILRNDAGTYHITGKGSVCIKYGVFTGDIHLSDHARLEISPEAVFEGTVKGTKHTEIVNRGTWNADLQLNAHFINYGPMYLKKFSVREHGVFTHRGPAKVLVAGDIQNEGIMHIHGLVLAERSIVNHGTLVLKHALVKTTEHFINKGVIHGGEQYIEVSAISVQGTFENHQSVGSLGEFLDVCAGSIQSHVPFHPRVSQCAATPKLHALAWLGMEVAIDAQEHTISWFTAEAHHNKVYVVQKSSDGKQFRNVSVIDQGKEVNQLIQYYQFVDEVVQPQEDTYYRVMSLNKDGEHLYSDVYAVRAISISKNK